MIKGHLVNPRTEEWYEYDENYNLWSCSCRSNKELKVSLCLSLCTHLLEEGEYNEIRRKTAQKRKELGLLESLTIEDLQKLKETE